MKYISYVRTNWQVTTLHVLFCQQATCVNKMAAHWYIVIFINIFVVFDRMYICINRQRIVRHTMYILNSY